MEAESDFDVPGFEKKLTNLKDTQDGIQSLSAWCLHNHVHHKKIVAAWLNVLKQVKVEHRLVLFYLANDVIQHSKRKNYDFVESWGTALQKATTMVRDDKVKHKILRILKIWGDRQIYDEDFLTDLNGLLSATLPKAKPKEADSDEFQVQTVISSIRQCVILQTETDRSLKSVVKSVLPDIPKTFKDRTHCATIKKQVDDDVRRHERYIQNLKAEIKARNLLITALAQADEFYSTQRGEVKVVANAYKNFGNRIKTMKKKIDELATTLPSPCPSPDVNAPSPGPDNDFDLPTDGSFPTFGSNGFMTYMEGSLPFDPMDFNRKSPSPPVKSIQVINSNTSVNDSFGNSNSAINDFFKSLIPEAYDPGSSLSFNEYSMNSSTASFSGVPAPSAAPLPPYAPITMSNYGMSGNSSGFSRNNYTTQSGPNAVPPPPLPPPPQIESNNNNNQRYNNWEPTWNPRQDPANPLLDTPHSPPHYERKAANPSAPIEYVDLEAGSLEAGSDVDHRTLTDILATRVVDIDHRNLISLTGSPRDNDTSLVGDKLSEDIDFRKHLFNLEPPPPPSLDDITLTKSGDADFRVGGSDAPSNSGDDDGLEFDLNTFNPSILPPILEPPSLGDLAKLLDTKVGQNQNNYNENNEGNIRKKQKTHNGNDEGDSVDMEMSDEEGNLMFEPSPEQEELSQISSKTSLSNNEQESPPESNSLQPPPIPNFDFDQWNESQEIYDPDDDNEELDNQVPYGMHDQHEQSWHTVSPTNTSSPQWGMLGQRLLQMSQTVPGAPMPPTPPPGYMPRPPLLPMPPNRPPMYNNQQHSQQHPHPGFGSPNFNNRGRGRGMMNRGGVMLRGGPFFRGSPGGPIRPFRGGLNFRGGPPRGRW